MNLKEFIRSRLGSYELATNSEMSELDAELGIETQQLLDTMKDSIENLPVRRNPESGNEFFVRVLEWASDPELNPEPSLYVELRGIGNKYGSPYES